MIVFREEYYEDIQYELEPLMRMHWEVVSLYEDALLKPNWDAWRRASAQGLLHITTARSDGKLVGYHAYHLTRHAHCLDKLVAKSEGVFLHPEYRKGRAGVRLITEPEKYLARLGVATLFFPYTTKNDIGNLMDRLGYAKTEILTAKHLCPTMT